MMYTHLLFNILSWCNLCVLIIAKRKDKSFIKIYKVNWINMRSEVDQYLINRVREKRKELGISQRGIAALLECHPSYIGQIESDKFDTKYSVHQLFHLAQLLDCSLSDLLPPLDMD